ncbi:hypothetical protein [Ralstonia pseudosolanacearum]|uniref:hypothetical protein n=1 Tax=Ralstonia pseudosolanacearum TaxID=1310165 RepID=UPI0026745F5F|nr:hypothetical protein [Ralstonia pseudosolanacearum]MDO3541036.1 hypothetical protein [Ralstonia pseudosolanacearum]
MIDTDMTCPSSSGHVFEPVVRRFQFVTLAFERQQRVFSLPQWHWPVLGPYNGFSGGARIRAWQLIRFYQMNGWLHYPDVCSVTGRLGGTQLHDEDYSRPWTAYPVSKRAHTLIHTRARFPRAWAEFLAKEALPITWAKTLSPDGGTGKAVRDSTAFDLLEQAPHPAWVAVSVNEFDPR